MVTQTMGECNGCGRCCDPVVMPYGPDDLRRLKDRLDPDEYRWATEDLTLLGRREGMRRAEYLESGMTFGIGPDGVIMLWSYFYDCRWFDKDRRVCTNYDNRPDVCSGYPWMGDPPDRRKALPPECGFVVDVGRVPVKMGPTRA